MADDIRGDDSGGNETEHSMDVAPTIALRVTGPWTAPEEFGTALKKAAGGYELREKGLLHVASGRKFNCDATVHDDDIAELFADSGRLSDAEIDEIAAHKVKVHLSAPGGSPEAARAIMDAATALLHAGGTGVFIDNSGCAHGKRDWLKLAGDKQPGGLYWAYVAVTGGADEIFSTGMHCLGFRDAEMPDPPDRQFGGFFVHNFLGYMYQSGATILDGEMLGDEGEPMYRVRDTPCTRFPADAPFHNPYGVWRLEAANGVEFPEGEED
jgi:hypothetical protein